MKEARAAGVERSKIVLLGKKQVYAPTAHPSLARERLLMCQKMLRDSPTRGVPYTVMRADVLERRVERADTTRLAGDEQGRTS
jgi:hypothetical protein